MSYRSIVVVREVWDTRDLTTHVLGENGKLNDGVLQTRFEPEDLNALEMALQIKDKHGGKVTALSIGEPRNVDVLRECLYRGADEVVRLDAPDFKELDTISAATLLAKAIRKMGEYDLILSGVNVVEGENSLLGAQLACLLGIDQISYVDSLEEVSGGRVRCKRSVEMGYEIVETKLPAAIVAGVALLKDDPRTPRSAKAVLKLKLKKAPIQTWSAKELGIEDMSQLKTIQMLRYETVEQRNIESRNIDPGDESALKGMLNEVTS